MVIVIITINIRAVKKYALQIESLIALVVLSYSLVRSQTLIPAPTQSGIQSLFAGAL